MLTLFTIFGLALLWTVFCAWRHTRIHGKAQTKLSNHIDKIIK